MLFIDSLPIEMRAMSVTSFILFSAVAVVILLFCKRMLALEVVVAEYNTELQKLFVMTTTIEETIRSIDVLDHQHCEWVKDYGNRVEKSLMEIREHARKR